MLNYASEIAEEQQVQPSRSFSPLIRQTNQIKEQIEQKQADPEEIEPYAQHLYHHHLKNQLSDLQRKYSKLQSEKNIQKSIQKDLKTQEIVMLKNDFDREIERYNLQFVEFKKQIEHLNGVIENQRIENQDLKYELTELQKEIQDQSALQQNNNELVQRIHQVCQENERIKYSNEELSLNLNNAYNKLNHFEEMKDMIKQYEEDMSVLREIRKKYEIDFLYLKNNEEGMKSKVQNQDQELKFMRKKANGQDVKFQEKMDEVEAKHLKQLQHVEYLFQESVQDFGNKIDELNKKNLEYQKKNHQQQELIKTLKSSIKKYQIQEEEQLRLIKKLENQNRSLEDQFEREREEFRIRSEEWGQEIYKLRELYEIKIEAYRQKLKQY